MGTTRNATNHPNSPNQVDVLLVTVTDVEAQAVFDAFTPRQRKQRHFIGDNTYYDLGLHGNACVLMVQSDMGTGGLAGTQATVQASIEALHPDSVVMVGIAFGTDSKSQKIGDILVSRQLVPYELQRVGTDKSGKQNRVPRGDRVHASVRLVDRFVAGKKDWNGQTVHIGLVLSGEKLVDNFLFRQQLLDLEPEAIGGEMEGAGLYAAAQRAKVDWILVKAICDWADGYKGQNKKQRQQLASQNAARFVLYVVRLGGLIPSRQDHSTIAGLLDHVAELRRQASQWKTLHQECQYISFQLVLLHRTLLLPNLEIMLKDIESHWLLACTNTIDAFIRHHSLAHSPVYDVFISSVQDKNWFVALQSGTEDLNKIIRECVTAKDLRDRLPNAVRRLCDITQVISEILMFVDTRLRMTIDELDAAIDAARAALTN